MTDKNRNQKEDMEMPGRKALELYLHIPFCMKKCKYCDFLSFTSDAETEKAYMQALQRELCAISVEDQYEVRSVFIGGGTPSCLSPEDISLCLQIITNKFSMCRDCEITIEANPGTLDMDKLKTYRNSGINRLSLGLQSPDALELATLGRIHTYEEFLESYHLAREAGFDNINIDLMSALPGQTIYGWRSNLEKVISLCPEHISAYSLIIEEGTPFASMDLKLPDEDEEYQMYEDTYRILSSAGYHQYEISNYAKEGKECLHNVGYWQRIEYLGLGLGAASLIKNKRYSNTRDLGEYIKNSAHPSEIMREAEILSPEDQMSETMILGLRMNRGVSEQEFLRQFGQDMTDRYGKILYHYKDTGFMQRSPDGRWSFTRKGIHVSNTILSEFL